MPELVVVFVLSYVACVGTTQATPRLDIDINSEPTLSTGAIIFELSYFRAVTISASIVFTSATLTRQSVIVQFVIPEHDPRVAEPAT